MSEKWIESNLGDEIGVTVYFDYQPVEYQTHDDPGCDSEVTINSVCVDNDENKDILGIIKDSVLDSLRMECFEHMESDA